jgi:TolA-binding protein
MIRSSDEPKWGHALLALTELARDSARPPTPLRIERGLHRLATSIATAQSRQGRVLRWSLVGAATACAVVAFAIFVMSRPHLASPQASTLSYKIEGGTVVEGGYLRESGRAGIALAFSEGTEFFLMPGTRGRLCSVDSSGARIAIEHGTASFHVTPSGGRRWLVDVGPFQVTVKGTVFTVSWDASSERFELNLERGQVTVRGPVSGGDITLQGGQRLVVDLPAAETIISEDKLAKPAESPAAPMTPVPSEPPVPTSGKPAARSTTTTSSVLGGMKVDGEHRWTEALAAGHWDEILADAEREGVKAALDQASSEALIALADAARYRRRMDLARQVLLAERRRFPGSARSLDAAFLLGRVEESGEHGVERALRWYDEYLTRSPNGTYASEALGRKMTLTSKLGGAAQARPVAEAYLRRFPSGSYAGAARALWRAP